MASKTTGAGSRKRSGRTIHSALRIAGVGVSLVLGAVSPGRAFTQKEHERVSAEAFAQAIQCLADTHCREATLGSACEDFDLDELEQASLDSLSESGASSLSYSDFVAAVDFVLDPTKLLEQEPKANRQAQNEITSCAADLCLPRSSEDLNRYALFELREKLVTHAWAAQNNDSHFQQQTLLSSWFWHRAALQAAAYGDSGRVRTDRYARRLYAGLVMNAISNHFLEDFMAPGHVTTPREGLQDYAAIGMHDLYNRRGRPFVVDSDTFAKLRPLVSLPIGDPAAARAQDLARADFEHILAYPRLMVRGDGYLLERESRQARLFLTLVVARSILDVFESFACGEMRNSTPSYDWKPQHRDLAGKLFLAGGGFGYGRYEEQQTKRVDYGPLTLVEVSMQASPWNSPESTRGVLSFVYIPTRWAPPPGRNVNGTYVPETMTGILSVGVSYRRDNNLSGFGAFTRASLLLPRLDMHFGLSLGAENYRWDSEDVWKFHPELRIGIGVSFVTAFFGVGYDYDLKPSRRLAGAPTLRTGVAVGIPWQRMRRH